VKKIKVSLKLKLNEDYLVLATPHLNINSVLLISGVLPI
jgi:hypothetical protein